ncbi:MAG: response regulator transcription factor [Bacteroidia bacterium]
MNKIRVFVVDDHHMVIEGIRVLLQDDPDIEFSGHASHAASCMSFLEKNSPDIILLDFSLPDKNGAELCAEITQKYPTARVLGLSTFNQQSYIRSMLDHGAMGYVLKNATRQELSLAIKQVYSGNRYLSFEAAKMLREANQSKDHLPALTRREKEVLALISSGKTNPEIAGQLSVSVTTVDTHRKNLLAKFNVRNTAELIKIAAQNGLV